MSFKTFIKFIWSFFVIASFSVYVYWNRVQEPYIAPASTPVTAGNDPTQAIRDAILSIGEITDDNVPATPAVVISPKTTPKPPVTNPAPIPAPTPIPAPVQVGMYKNGSYVGSLVDAYYGNVQVKVIISGGRITDVQFLDYPKDRSTSRSINSYAMPMLKAEAIQAQSANVDIVSGASATSGGFQESLGVALAAAKN